jgi:hypothetical protein
MGDVVRCGPIGEWIIPEGGQRENREAVVAGFFVAGEKCHDRSPAGVIEVRVSKVKRLSHLQNNFFAQTLRYAQNFILGISNICLR